MTNGRNKNSLLAVDSSVANLEKLSRNFVVTSRKKAAIYSWPGSPLFQTQKMSKCTLHLRLVHGKQRAWPNRHWNHIGFTSIYTGCIIGASDKNSNHHHLLQQCPSAFYSIEQLELQHPLLPFLLFCRWSIQTENGSKIISYLDRTIPQHITISIKFIAITSKWPVLLFQFHNPYYSHFDRYLFTSLSGPQLKYFSIDQLCI